jgi:hypothetical protein
LIATHSQAQSSKPAPSSEMADKIIKTYPNPATTYITFDVQKGFEKGMSIQVYSFLGKKMTDMQKVSSRSIIDLTEYNRGLYMYHLLDATGKVIESGKFQVTK